MCPTYRYRREDNTEFEVRQSINDDALEECPETGQKVKRVITGGNGTLYRGDGFPTKKLRKKNNYRKKLQEDPFYTSIGDKRDKLDDSLERQREMMKKQRMDS